MCSLSTPFAVIIMITVAVDLASHCLSAPLLLPFPPPLSLGHTCVCVCVCVRP